MGGTQLNHETHNDMRRWIDERVIDISNRRYEIAEEKGAGAFWGEYDALLDLRKAIMRFQTHPLTAYKVLDKAIKEVDYRLWLEDAEGMHSYEYYKAYKGALVQARQAFSKAQSQGLISEERDEKET